MDTICAIATAPGGAIGIIRLSGPETFSITQRVCPRVVPGCPARTAILSPILSPSAGLGTQPLDEVLVTHFPSPHSYTGEDCAEISCHGSAYILNKVLELLISQGARLAQPGEFTQRAYLNGKMDLSQAEAVADLIASTNQATHQLAMSQLRGQFSSELSTLREKLLHLTSLLELELDFSDHEELEFANRNELLSLAQDIDKRITTLAHSFETGQALKQGVPVAIAGKTNVGKSTLLNRLLKDDRAIVSDVHGTTRDTIEDTINLRGVQFRFIDTAGLRQTSDEVEQIGIERTYAAIEKARIILWVIDEKPSQDELEGMLERCKDKQLIVIKNKTDLSTSFVQTEFVLSSTLENTKEAPSNIRAILSISAKFDKDITALEDAVYSAAGITLPADTDVIITSARHYEALLRAHDSLSRVIQGLTPPSSPTAFPVPTDLIAEDLRLTLSALADITGGAITPQETLNNIFSHFCVGK
ncbi:MAG: tRNA uridine-5-carboxymethylaminomethyl(34) synthesis GTPase MnmE [Bacteroidaceae bacterium]|nr:tRNA uridine-5-carboxymethylaminomethyl(34) synthesis GTPase MnmE [Bacteroidaceae bacterium]